MTMPRVEYHQRRIAPRIPFFVSGIGQEQEIDPVAICGSADKVAKVEVQQSFINGLLGFITYGIYTPRQARVYCVK